MDKMQAALKQYLTSKEMNERLCKDLQELVKNNVNVDMSSEKLIAVAVGLMNQYRVCQGKWYHPDRCGQHSCLFKSGNPAADQRGSRESG